MFGERVEDGGESAFALNIPPGVQKERVNRTKCFPLESEADSEKWPPFLEHFYLNVCINKAFA